MKLRIKEIREEGLFGSHRAPYINIALGSNERGEEMVKKKEFGCDVCGIRSNTRAELVEAGCIEDPFTL